MATYFEYPWRGDVYAVDVSRRTWGRLLVRLPSGEVISLLLEPGRFPKADGPLQDRFGPEEIRKALLVFKREEAEREYKGNWTPLIELLNAAAAVNTLFAIILTPEEYARLESGGLERLKKRLSARAASLLMLCEDPWHDTGEKPTLELLRTGRCP